MKHDTTENDVKMKHDLSEHDVKMKHDLIEDEVKMKHDLLKRGLFHYQNNFFFLLFTFHKLVSQRQEIPLNRPLAYSLHFREVQLKVYYFVKLKFDFVHFLDSSSRE
jgi:hypothetical protein